MVRRAEDRGLTPIERVESRLSEVEVRLAGIEGGLRLIGWGFPIAVSIAAIVIVRLHS